MNLTGHIRELLYQYDCVIVPQLGGFVCSFNPARIHPVQHRFHPPSKRISFNQMLSMNDGLLAQSVAIAERIPFGDALRQIEETIRLWKEELRKNGYLEFEGIGRLHLNAGGQLQFEPGEKVNYLRESYGLTEFQVLPLDEPKVVRMPVEKQAVREVRSKASPLLIQSLRYSAAAALLSIAVLATVRLQLLPDISVNYSSFNPFRKEKAVYHPVAHDIFHETPSGVHPESHEIEKKLFFDDGPLAGTGFDVVGKTEILVPATVEITKPFHVVGGCFSIKRNAEKLVRQLQQKGYPSVMEGTYNNLHVVAYNSFSDEEAAREFLQKVQLEDNPQAWILKK